MDATLSESEELLRETARRLGSDLACGSVAEYADFDDTKAWRSLADMGLLGIRLPDEVGGGDGSTLDQSLVVEALAFHSVAVPFLGSAALASELLLAAGASQETLSRLASGELRVALGLTDDLSSIWREGASKNAVAFDSAGAQAALVFDSSDAGVTLRSVALGEPLPGLDLTRRSHRVNCETVVDVGDLGGVIDADTYERTIARCLTLVAWDLVGVMDAGIATAVEYAKSREQFGVAIATFQAVQHICADQLVSLEGARSMAEYAAWAVDECDTADALLAARSAKAFASREGRAVTEAVVQVHGGMGFTWDCPAHVFLKRALSDALLFGDAPRQINEIAQLRSRSRA
ncbi:MAG TPA: acyl-CoA dehydrogenase family protein [Acidimicrobiales bacterium]|jgi:alkylation response protein AidB-like acyl-CoA dehydrogenase|nr:acyl-CoA dehydrogenase family protein [Acidimicrobiales bacterium]